MNRILIKALLVTLMSAAHLSAGEIVLKTGAILKFEKYRTTEHVLLYMDDQGKEIAIHLSDIDLERTMKLNAGTSEPVILPGMNLVQLSRPQEQPLSLGEIARRAKFQEKSESAKHSYTDDDVAHTSGNISASQPKIGRTLDSPANLDNAQKLVDKWAGKTPRELSDAAVRDNQFPERDIWEKQLFDQKEKMVSAAQAALDAAARLANAGNDDERSAAQRATSKLLSDLDSQRRQYDQLLAEGVKRASEWERRQ